VSTEDSEESMARGRTKVEERDALFLPILCCSQSDDNPKKK